MTAQESQGIPAVTQHSWVKKANKLGGVTESGEPVVIGKMCCGRTPLQSLINGKQIWKKKFFG